MYCAQTPTLKVAVSYKKGSNLQLVHESSIKHAKLNSPFVNGAIAVCILSAVTQLKQLIHLSRATETSIHINTLGMKLSSKQNMQHRSVRHHRCW